MNSLIVYLVVDYTDLKVITPIVYMITPIVCCDYTDYFKTIILMTSFEKDELTEKIISCCFLVHTQLGPGFKEEIYRRALIIAFKNARLNFESEKEFDVHFNSEQIGKFRCDFLIEEKVILEIKSVTGTMPVLFRQQLLSYLKASKIKTGLLINFGNKSCDVKRYSN